MPEEEQTKDDFKYIVRLVNTDLDGHQSVEIALSHIKGIGLRTANVIADIANVSRYEKIGNLRDEKIEELEKVIHNLSSIAPAWMFNRRKDYETGKDIHLIGGELDVFLREDINLMKKIRCYRGIRHEQGQKVRGQRTRSNGRTGLTVGVQRKGRGGR